MLWSPHDAIRFFRRDNGSVDIIVEPSHPSMNQWTALSPNFWFNLHSAPYILWFEDNPSYLDLNCRPEYTTSQLFLRAASSGMRRLNKWFSRCFKLPNRSGCRSHRTNAFVVATILKIKLILWGGMPPSGQWHSRCDKWIRKRKTPYVCSFDLILE